MTGRSTCWWESQTGTVYSMMGWTWPNDTNTNKPTLLEDCMFTTSSLHLQILLWIIKVAWVVRCDLCSNLEYSEEEVMSEWPHSLVWNQLIPGARQDRDRWKRNWKFRWWLQYPSCLIVLFTFYNVLLGLQCCLLNQLVVFSMQSPSSWLHICR